MIIMKKIFISPIEGRRISKSRQPGKHREIGPVQAIKKNNEL